ncbi:MAG: ribosome silencing factor [Phycisphaerales bacterium]|nr:ribosome silencing factor [Phycisphaerales bacterium]
MTATEIEPQLLAAMLARRASDTRCNNIVVLDLRGRSPVTEFFVLATGTSNRQIRTVCDEVADLGRRHGYAPWRTSGYELAKWILVDFVSVVVHVFDAESRDFYDLEMLWGDCPRVDWASLAPAGEPAEPSRVLVETLTSPRPGEPAEVVEALVIDALADSTASEASAAGTQQPTAATTPADELTDDAIITVETLEVVKAPDPAAVAAAKAATSTATPPKRRAAAPRKTAKKAPAAKAKPVAKHPQKAAAKAKPVKRAAASSAAKRRKPAAKKSVKKAKAPKAGKAAKARKPAKPVKSAKPAKRAPKRPATKSAKAVGKRKPSA